MSIFIDVLRKILDQQICPQIVSLEIKWNNPASLDGSLEDRGRQCNWHKVGLDFLSGTLPMYQSAGFFA